jgi:hypothetical protein
MGMPTERPRLTGEEEAESRIFGIKEQRWDRMSLVICCVTCVLI